jgi:hypothetical protein
MKKLYLIFIMGAILLGACLPFWGNQSPISGSNWGSSGNYSSNGEMIYFTAINYQGDRISYTGGPAFGGMMMGSRVTCEACHRANGRGGTHIMHMDVMDAPDIRFHALSGESYVTSDGHDDHDDEHADYDLEIFRQAVVEGKHPNGEPLNWDMPRWTLGDEDLNDLFEFLKSLE